VVSLRSLMFSYIQRHCKLRCHVPTDVISIYFLSFSIVKCTDLCLFSGKAIDVCIPCFVLFMTTELQSDLCKSDILSVDYL